MAQVVRAIYEHGTLKLLDPVELEEGEQIAITIESERERVLNALAEIITHVPDPIADEELDEEAILRELDEAFRGQPPLSETIIQERREGP